MVYKIITHGPPAIIISKMASSLFIGYARTTCTTEQVKSVFNNVLDEEIVSTVDECIKKDPKGYEFKIFFVHFSQTNHRLQQMVDRISKEGFVPIVYNTEYDKKVGARVERYWKVLPFTPKPVQITGVRIMTEEEASAIARPKHLDAPIVEGVVIALEDEATKEEDIKE